LIVDLLFVEYLKTLPTTCISLTAMMPVGRAAKKALGPNSDTLSLIFHFAPLSNENQKGIDAVGI